MIKRLHPKKKRLNPKIKRFIPIEELVKNDLKDINNYCNYLNSRSVERKKLQNNLSDYFGLNKM